MSSPDRWTHLMILACSLLSGQQVCLLARGDPQEDNIHQS
jgi:hypothetical protein